eukprot:TRINITY_DN57096_c0_g1_i1.p1 TRINITY_DN57096_c0_g1~~TRINITY_DN57096_c0_g1_i1.p1  ORF type:complete len:291 (+),score=43.86 TRINITY_DN57096_c0_g1_i1:109-873(+)
MVTSNVLATKKKFGGKGNKELSDEHPTYVSPDGKTFAIWGLIYLLETVLVVAQAIPSAKTDALFAATCPITGLNVRQRIIGAFLANSLWLPVFNNEFFFSALGVMAVYLGFLGSIYLDLNTATVEGFGEQVYFVAGIAMNTSWLAIAFIVSLFFCGGEMGWKDQYGVAGNPFAGIFAVLAVCAFGCERVVRAYDFYWAFVAAWGLRGIYRMQTEEDAVRFPIGAMNMSLATVACSCSFIVLATMLATMLLRVVF